MTLIALGLGQCLGGCPAVGVEVEPIHDAATTAGAVGLFVLLKAFSSGATALTGVEAISNGVPAFKRPQAHNAATTLAIMGGDRDLDVPRHLVARHARRGRRRERGALGAGADRDRGLRRGIDRLLRRAGVHGRDPDPRREHGVPGLPTSRLDPGARPVPAEPVREPRRPPRLLQRRARARAAVGA